MTIDNSVIVDQPVLSVSYNTVYDLTQVTDLAIQATYAPIAGGSGTLSIAESVDGISYVPSPGGSIVISSPGTFIFEFRNIADHFYKITYTPTAGAIALKVQVLARDNTRVKA